MGPVLQPAGHFEPMEFIPGDSGMTAGSNCVVMYTKNRGETTLKGKMVSRVIIVPILRRTSM